MSEAAGREWTRDVRRLVVKLGSRVLVDERHRIDEAQVASLVAQMAAARASGVQVVCVSSGAIAAGLGELGLERRPRDLPGLQAAAAVGQAGLIGLYRRLFGEHDLAVGQVLLTHADLRSRQRHLNARNTFIRLLGDGVVPLVNENDTVAVDEIRFGDNDVLSALVALLVRADALVILSNVEGLRADPDDEAAPVLGTVPRIDASIRALGGGAGSAMAVGGMRTKIRAAAMVTEAGERCVIANGRRPGVLGAVLRGEPVGTVFLPRPERMAGRKRWIAFFDHPRGDVIVDEGAGRALRDQGRSLLAAGVVAVRGAFHRGDPVRIIGPGDHEIGRGLVNYAAGDLQRIAGLRSDRIAEALDGPGFGEVIHRDNLVLSNGD